MLANTELLGKLGKYELTIIETSGGDIEKQLLLCMVSGSVNFWKAIWH